MNVIYIDNLNALKAMASAGAAATALALDTEFDRSKTFYPKLGLIQLVYSNQPDQQYLLDPVALSAADIVAYSGLAEQFHDETVVKVLHACAEDIEVLLHNLGLRETEKPFCHLFDTQVAAALVNIGSQIGYRDLIRHYVGIELSKDETRSDWMKRPLTPQQIEYAAKDVEYLLPCYKQLSGELEQLGRHSWVLEDSLRFVSACQKSEEIDRYYLKFQQGWNFDQQQVSLLQHLCVWREETARRMDTPRTHIVKDGSLFEIAEKQPHSVSGLLKLKSLRGKSRDIRHMKRFANQILDQVHVVEEKLDVAKGHAISGEAHETGGIKESDISGSNEIKEADGPALQPIERPLDRDLKAVFKECKSCVVAIAEAEGLPAERLLSKSELRRFVASYAHHLSSGEPLVISSVMKGWRYPLLYESIVEVLNRYRSQLIEQYERREQKAAEWQDGNAS